MTRNWILLLALSGGALFGQTQPSATAPQSLTLDEARRIAMQFNPRLRSAGYQAGAARSIVTQARSAYAPRVTGLVTGAAADLNTSIAAGPIQTASLASRFASGVEISQLITDFGRTRALTQGAELNAKSQGSITDTVRAQVLLEVSQSYFDALRADAVLKVAQGNLENRRLIARQVRALQESALKSTVDVSFAEVNASEAELLLYRAENDQKAALARLAAAMGADLPDAVTLADQAQAGELGVGVDAAVAEGIRNRPELAALDAKRLAAQRQADAERRLRYPTLSLGAVAGVIPAHVEHLQGSYSSAAVTLSVPILNGHLFSARFEEADQRARAADEDFKSASLDVTRDVRVAWLEANNAYRRLGVTRALVRQADEAFRLAKARYDAGLGSIVELNQAQLNQTSAQIAAASAKFDYLARRVALEYTEGALR